MTVRDNPKMYAGKSDRNFSAVLDITYSDARTHWRCMKASLFSQIGQPFLARNSDHHHYAMGLALFVFLHLPLVVIVVIFLEKTSGNVVTINSFKCVQGEMLCPNMTCSTTMTRNGVHKINCGCFVPRPVYNLTVALKLQRKKGGMYETIVNTKENMCDVDRKTIRSQIMTRIFEAIKRYFTNFKCPFQGNVTATNMPVSLSFAPGFMPAADYRVLVDIRVLEEPMLGVELNFSIGKNKFRRN